jgi:hypothetical protein
LTNLDYDANDLGDSAGDCGQHKDYLEISSRLPVASMLHF